MENNDSFDSKIKNAVKNINKKATDSAPESNWVGVLGRSENISSKKSLTLVAKKYKIISAAASILLVALIGVLLATTLSDNGSKTVKTTDSTTTTTKQKQDTTSTITSAPVEETTVPTAAPNLTATTKPKSTATSATNPAPAPTAPGNPSNLAFTGRDVVNPGSPGTYNVYFSWSPSPTPGVKYCVATTSVGSSQVFPNCNWSYPYLEAGTTTGFGLVFEENTTYQFQVTAIDSNNQRSDTIYLDWQLP